MMRPRDNDYGDAYTDWPFMSVQTWGENPHGEWKIITWDDVSAATLMLYCSCATANADASVGSSADANAELMLN